MTGIDAERDYRITRFPCQHAIVDESGECYVRGDCISFMAWMSVGYGPIPAPDGENPFGFTYTSSLCRARSVPLPRVAVFLDWVCR